MCLRACRYVRFSYRLLQLACSASLLPASDGALRWICRPAPRRRDNGGAAQRRERDVRQQEPALPATIVDQAPACVHRLCCSGRRPKSPHLNLHV